MAKVPGGSSLDEFLSQTQGPNGPCAYVRSTTEAQRTLIREKHELGFHRWAAFSRWLESEGTDCVPSLIQGHFARGHDDER